MKGKVLENKRLKESKLLQSAFDLFTKADIHSVTINDIVKHAGVAKGTFYLYFKDKYQMRDVLIQKEANRLFVNAFEQLEQNDIRNFEDRTIFLINQILIRLENNPQTLNFIEKNLSLGLVQSQIESVISQDSYNLLTVFKEDAKKSGYEYSNPEVILYIIIELAGSTCYDAIINQKPLPINEYKPYLFNSIRAILKQGKIND